MCSIVRFGTECNETISTADIPHSRSLFRVDYAKKVNIVAADTIVTHVI